MKLKNFLRSLICMVLICPFFGSLSASADTIITVSESVDDYGQLIYTGLDSDRNQFFFMVDGDKVRVTNLIPKQNIVKLPRQIQLNSSSNPTLLNISEINAWLDVNSVTSFVVPDNYTSVYLSCERGKITFEGMMPPSVSLSSEMKIIVPSDAFMTYKSYCDEKKNGWNSDLFVVHDNYINSGITVNVSEPGSFEEELMQELFLTGKTIDNLYYLKVTGNINGRDLSYMSNLYHMCSLDLSSVNGITTMLGCSNLKYLEKVVLPSYVAEIDASAFYGCYQLSTINLDFIKAIGENAFAYCHSLEAVYMPNIKKIEYAAFSNTGIKQFCIYDNVEYQMDILSFSQVESLIIYNNISYNTLRYMYNLKEGEVERDGMGEMSKICYVHV